MSKRNVNSEKAPAAIGPYSQAIEVEGTIYVSGQLPIDAATGEFASDEIKGQTKQSLEKCFLRSNPQRSRMHNGECRKNNSFIAGYE